MARTPAHGRTAERRHGGWLIAAVGVVVVALLAVGAVFLVPRPHAPTAAATATPKIHPLTVLATAPAASAAAVPASAAVTVDLSTPLAAASPTPTLTPPVAGTWSLVSPTRLQFLATAPFVPGATETLSVPGGPTGLLGADRQRLATTVSTTFSVAPATTLRLQQLLAELGYLPLTFTPATPLTSPRQEADPQAGTFTWRWAAQPAQLVALWTPGTYNTITRGAVMSFQSEHNLASDGVPGPQTWTALLAAAAAGASDPAPYGYVLVSRALPESATVYQNGAAVYHTIVNTGIAVSPTVPGTFPVYLRYTVTTMSGTNPDGSHYHDTGIPWTSYFNGGDALHGFIRPSYGSPQSLGCVEMPFANAAVVYPMTPIGTLVTVV